jgi:WD40 repeat protein
MGMVGAPLGGGALSATAGAGASSVASASIPPSSIYARSCEYFIAPVGAVSVSSSAQAMVPSGGGATAAAAAAAAQQHASSSAFDSADRVLEALLTAEWRRKRNEGVIASASSIRQDLYDVHERGTFEQVGALSTGFEQVSALLFHPFEPLLVVGEKRQVGVWDVKEMERINLFSNENARGTKISALQWINEQHVSLLLAGSDDGVVRLWKNVHVRDTAPEIVSAWLAVRSMPRGSGVGLVLDWQQETGHLLAAGPVDSIRVWDVEREICVLDLPVDSNSYVSSVCSMAEGGVVFAGCGDGVVRMFDLRADNHTIHTVSKHTGSVVNVHMQRWGGLDYDGDLISGGVNGDIHLSDTRMLGQSATAGAAHSSSFSSSSSASALNSSVVRSMAAFDKAGLPLDALAVHEHAPLFAAGSRKQVVRIADFKSSPGGAGTVSAPSAAPAPLPGLGTSMPAGLGAGSIGGGQAGGSISLNHSGGSTGHSSSSAPGSGPTGATVSTLKYFKGFMGHRIGPVTSLAFHPSVLPQSTTRCWLTCLLRLSFRYRMASDYLWFAVHGCLCVVLPVFSHKLLMAVGAFNPLVSIMAAFPPSSL